VGIEIIHQRDYFLVFQPVITEPLTDMRPVFLFYMGVVILMVWSAPGKLDRFDFIAEVFNEVMINELSAVIAVKSFQWEREHGLDILYLLKDTSFTFAPDSALFCPSGSDGQLG